MNKLILIAGLIIVAVIAALNYQRSEPVKSPGPELKPEDLISVIEPAPSLLVSPERILPGDPMLATITSTSTPVEFTFDGLKYPIFLYEGKYRALIGIDFNEKVLEHRAEVKFENGSSISNVLTITPREKIERPLGIPEKLGGNTPEAAKTVVDNLAKENASLNNIKTASTTLWTEAFKVPLAQIFVTDDYGYSRNTVGYNIAHKGTDFRAAVGTEVKAMNSGVVRIARTYVVYGNTVVIDHGLGLSTLYMHLSKLNVKEGDEVEAGDVIGLSGMTGYAEAAHLHVSVKINGVSIDPMKFLELFAAK